MSLLPMTKDVWLKHLYLVFLLFYFHFISHISIEKVNDLTFSVTG